MCIHMCMCLPKNKRVFIYVDVYLFAYVKCTFMLCIFIHICISKFIIKCDKHTLCNNNTLISNYKSENNISSIYFWLYLTIMSVLCCIWEILYKYFKLKRKNKLEKQKIIYLIFSTIISLSAFLSTIFYVDDHHVFECFLNYNKIIANTAFFLSYAIIVIFSVFENYFKNGKK